MNVTFCIVFSLITMARICLAQCPSDLGRTIERLPNTNVNAFSQQENPSNTASATCPYTTGGVVTAYPVSWFTQSPSVRISIQTATFDPQTEYFAVVSSNSAGTATIKVSKYSTNAVCTTGSCYGTQCANSPRCQGTCSITSSAATCANSCSGTCSTSCVCAATTLNTCTSECQACQGPCTGQCDQLGTNSFCIGFGSFPIPAWPQPFTYTSSCQGICSNCNGGAPGCNGVLVGVQCRGICFACGSAAGQGGQAQCEGILNIGGTIPALPLNPINCDGVVPQFSTCTGTCRGIGQCTGSPLIGNCLSTNNAQCTNCNQSGSGTGTCLPTSGFRGDCSLMGGEQCNGICYVCTGTCSGAPNLIQPGSCTGLCTSCTGRCQGTPTLNIGVSNACIGTLTGFCIDPNPATTWTGECNDCDGTCTGNGSAAGGACLRSPQSSAVEALPGEVTVNFYGVDQ